MNSRLRSEKTSLSGTRDGKRPRRIAALLAAGAALAVLAGCARASAPATYSNGEFCISFPRPRHWVIASEETLPTVVEFRNARGPGRVVLSIREDRDLIFAPPERYLDSFGERQKDDDPSFRLGAESGTNINGIAGLHFIATTENEKGEGFYFIRNNAEYCLLGLMPRSEQDDGEMLPVALAGLSVCDMPDSPTPWEYPVEPATDFGGALRYGRDLLKTRDVNVANYQRAIEQFRSVLQATHKMSPQPEEYQAALRMLEVAKAFQSQAFRDYRFRAEQQIGLRDRAGALAAADYLLDLIPDRNDPRHRVAMSLYQKAQNIPAGP